MSLSNARICRVFPHLNADGPLNMARDEALLDLVSLDPEAAALRTYGWTEPTLSIGYFQSIAEAESDPRWGTAPIVRRSTGGGAIWHDQELTYALAIPRGHPLAHRSEELYNAVHSAICGLLIELGIDAHRRGEETSISAQLPRPFLCFADRDREDLVVGPVKVVGSAQRRRAGAILQHGSILLAQSLQVPQLMGLADLAPIPRDIAIWSELLGSRLPEALGFLASAEEWSDEVLARARELEQSVYREVGWARRR